MIDQSQHGDAAPETTPDRASTLNPHRSWFDRLRMRLQAEREVDDLTRDHDRDQRVIAEAAVRLPSDSLAIGLLFRASSRRSGEGRIR